MINDEIKKKFKFNKEPKKPEVNLCQYSKLVILVMSLRLNDANLVITLS